MSHEMRHKCGWLVCVTKWSALTSVADLDGPGPRIYYADGHATGYEQWCLRFDGQMQPKKWRNRVTMRARIENDHDP